MAGELTVEGEEMSGEIALTIPPGTRASDVEKMLVEALKDEIYRVADELEVIVSAHPTKYARQLPGRDEEGRTRYQVRGRREGGKLVPAIRG
jgi:hypothetical protein